MSDSLEGVYPELNDEEKVKVVELRKRVEGVEAPPSFERWLEHHPTLFMTQWLKARKWDVGEAFTMYSDAAAYRLKEGFETKPLFPVVIPIRGYDVAKLQELHGTEDRPTDQFVDKVAEEMSKCYAGSWHKWDKDGRPVYIERTGKIDAKQLVKNCKALASETGRDAEDTVVETHKQSMEIFRVLIEHQNEKLKEKGKFVAQSTFILDCHGLSLSHFRGAAMDLLFKTNAELDQKYFPEGLHRCYMVNAPTTVKVGFNMVKGMLDPDIRKRITFHSSGSGTEKALKEAIGEENLPEFLGGTCHCEGGCVREMGLRGAAGEDEDEGELLEFRLVPKAFKTHLVAMQPGRTVSWDWRTKHHHDIHFSVLFKSIESTTIETMPEKPGDGGTVVEKSTKCHKHTGSYKAEKDGVLTLMFDNSSAMMRNRSISAHITITDGDESERDKASG
jgi:plastocyanin